MSLADFEAQTLGGETVSLAQYAEGPTLIVNTASECGFTPQYRGLEALYRKYKDRGFTVLGFPCNQFGRQEPLDSDGIATFCSTTFHVTFPMFAKIEVNGNEAHPLYRWLEREKPGFLGTRTIKWNFTKFLLNHHGEPVKRYGPQKEPKALQSAIEALL